MAFRDVYYLGEKPICPVCGTNEEVEHNCFTNMYAGGREGWVRHQSYRCKKCVGSFWVEAENKTDEGIVAVAIKYKKDSPDSYSGCHSFA